MQVTAEFAPSAHRTRGVTRGVKGGTVPRAPNHYGGAKSLRGALESLNKGTSTFFNTVHLLPKDLRFVHGNAKPASCPRRHLASLRYCIEPARSKIDQVPLINGGPCKPRPII